MEIINKRLPENKGGSCNNAALRNGLASSGIVPCEYVVCNSRYLCGRRGREEGGHKLVTVLKFHSIRGPEKLGAGFVNVLSHGICNVVIFFIVQHTFFVFP